VRSFGLGELRALWRTTFRSSPPPAFTKDLIARLLCWHIQEQALGGLDPETTRHLASRARGNRSIALVRVVRNSRVGKKLALFVDGLTDPTKATTSNQAYEWEINKAAPVAVIDTAAKISKDR
jgi:Protein of unknown function (DUF2924)